MSSIAKIQIKAIKTKQGKLKLSNDEYRTILSERYWQNSCTALTYDEAKDLLDYLDQLAKERQVPGFKIMPRRNPATRGKRYESSIEGLRQEVCDLAGTRFGVGWEKPLNKLCYTSVGVNHWKFLNVAKAKAIREILLRLEAKGPYQARGGSNV